MPRFIGRKGDIINRLDVDRIDTVYYGITNINKVADRDADIGTVASRDSDVGAVADIDTEIGLLADIQDGTTDTSALTNLNGIRGNITTVAGAVDNVNTVVTNIANVNAVGGDIANVNTVATGIGLVTTVANDLNETISEIETVADDLNENLSEINTVAENIANVNTVGTGIANVNTVAGGMSLITTVANDLNEVVSEIETVADDLNESLSEINTVGDNIANVNTVAAANSNINTIISINSNIATVAGISDDVTTVAGNVSDIGTVADRDADISTVADRDANIGTVAARDANIGTVAARDANIGTVASRDADIGTVADRDADIGTVADRDADIGTVAGKATEIGRLGTADAVADMNTLGTSAIVSDMDAIAAIVANVTKVADIDSNVSTVAGIDAEVVAVAGDASDIGTVAAKATEIGRLGTADAVADMNILGTADVVNDMNVLGTSANVTAMDTCATNVADINSFANTYHGALSSDPAGGVSDQGDLYFDTVGLKMKVYNGSAWQNATSSVEGVVSFVEFTSSNASTRHYALSHDVGMEIVYLNGSKLVRGTSSTDKDYICVSGGSSTTALSSGGSATHIHLNSDTTVDDVISINAWGASGNTLAVPVSGGTFLGDIAISGDLTVSGDTTTVNTATLTVEDPLISLGSANTSNDVIDLGWYGTYGSTPKYAGLFRDAGDGKFKVFKELEAAPTTTVNTSGTGYAVGTLVASLEGNASTATALASARTIGGVSFDGTANINLPGVNTSGDQNTSGNAATVTTNANLTGDVTSSGNATSIASDVIVNADIKSDAAIAMSKTALVAGTGITLSTNTLNVDAAQTQITSLGTLTSLELSGNIDLADDTSIGISDTEERIEFDGAGDISVLDAKFGIGTNAPATKFHIADNYPDWSSKLVNTHSGGYGFVVSAGGASTTSMLVVDYNEANTLFELKGNGTTYLKGDVGIGTTSPSSIFEIVGASSPQLRIKDSTNNHIVGMQSYDTAANVGTISNTRFDIISNNSERITISADGNVGIGTTNPSDYHTAASNLVVYGSSHTGVTIATGGANSTSLYFADGTGTSDENRGSVTYDHGNNSMIFGTDTVGRMTINSSGNVAIGTTSTDIPLEVWGDGGGGGENQYGTLRLRDTAAYNASPEAGVGFGGKYANAGNITTFSQIRGSKENSTDANYAGDLSFWTSQHGTGIVQRMTINSIGKVGIGTTNPLQLLHVEPQSAMNGILIKQAHDSTPLGIENNNNSPAITIWNNGSTARGLDIQTNQGNQSANHSLVYLKTTSSTFSQPLIYAEQAGNGMGAHFKNIIGAGADNPVVHIETTNAAFDQPVLRVTNDGKSYGIQINNNDPGGSEGDSALRINQNAPGAGIYIDQDGAASGLYINQSSAGGIPLYITNNHTEEGIRVLCPSNGQGVRIDAGSGGNYVLRCNAEGGTLAARFDADGDYSLVGSPYSDRRLKENIIDSEYGLAEVLQLTPRKFNWITHPDLPKHGFIAQEVKSVAPNMVRGDDSDELGEDGGGGMSFDYNGMSAVLCKAIQELSAKVTALEGN